MTYRLKYFDRYYMDYRIAYESGLYELLMHWGIWMDVAAEWCIHKIDGDKMTLIGRSANEVN